MVQGCGLAVHMYKCKMNMKIIMAEINMGQLYACTVCMLHTCRRTTQVFTWTSMSPIYRELHVHVCTML